MSYDAMRMGFGRNGYQHHRDRLVIAVSIRDRDNGYREVCRMPSVRYADLADCLPRLRTLFPSPRYEVAVESRYEDGTR